MENSVSCDVRQHCSYSNTENLCRTLDNAGVPDDPRWRSFILYARNVNDHHYLNRQQRSRLQSMVLRILQEKDYSDMKFKHMMEENHRIISAPYLQKLESAVEESKSLLQEFTTILRKRKGDISNLGGHVLETLEKGTEPKEIIRALRTAFNKVIDTIGDDTDHLKTLVRTDSLTSLNNRRAFDERLAKNIETAVKGKSTLSLVLIDIDRFKEINDSFGHRIGDQALTTVAKHLREYCVVFQENSERGIFPARYGGDEFAVILPQEDGKEALDFAEGLRKTVEQYHFIIRDNRGLIVKTDVKITISVGIGTLRSDWSGDLRSALVDAADAGLYGAKARGRNRVEMG